MPVKIDTDRLFPPMDRAELDRRMDEFDLARRALKWMIEHRSYWDSRLQCLLQAPGNHLVSEPPDDVHVFIQTMALEVSLDAEHAR